MRGKNKRSNYSCSNNATPTSDHKCPVVSYDYVCSAGTKSGSNCIITGDKVPYCTKGQLNANKTACVYQVPKTITVPATTTPGSSSLDCQGGELNADNKTCTKYNYNYEYYEGVVISKAVTTYEYKWSTQDSIEGWTKTGQTRRIEA